MIYNDPNPCSGLSSSVNEKEAKASKFSNYVGGQDKYESLPKLDLSKLTKWTGWTNYPDSIPMESLNAPVTVGINGFDNHEYLIIRYKINGESRIGMHVFFSKGGDYSGNCAGHSGQREDINCFLNRSWQFKKTIDDLLKELTQTGKIEYQDFKIELV